MKKIIILGTFLGVALFTFASCNQSLLEIPQKGVIAYEDFFDGSAESAESAALNAYAAGIKCHNLGAFFSPHTIAPSYFVLTNAPSDDIYYGSGSPGDHVFGLEINEYRPSFGSHSDIIANDYKGFYQFIYACNLVTDNFEYGASASIDRNISEARVLRALAHLHLASYWGNPPLVDHIIGGDARPTNSNHDELMQWIVKEFTEAAAYLPSRSSASDKNGAIRLTKEAALALAGKAQVQAGDYAGAKANLKKVIDSGKYALVPGSEMRNIFHRAGDGSPEKVFEFNYVDNVNLSPFGGFRHFQRNASCWWRDLKSLPDQVISAIGWGGGGNPSKSFVDAIVANEGDSYRRKAWVISYEELLGDFSYGGDKMSYEERLMDPNRGLSVNAYYGNCGWFTYKFAPYKSDLITNSGTDTDNNTVIMRYAEVLLLYAEACAQTGDPDGLKYLNMVAERAGAPTYSACTLDNVKKEKRFELYMEGYRFLDLVRWGDAATVLKDQGKEVPSFTDPFVEGSHPHEAKIDLSNAYYNKEYGFKANKNEVMPYPFGELQLNPYNEAEGVGLKQNPGWE